MQCTWDGEVSREIVCVTSEGRVVLGANEYSTADCTGEINSSYFINEVEQCNGQGLAYQCVPHKNAPDLAEREGLVT